MKRKRYYIISGHNPDLWKLEKPGKSYSPKLTSDSPFPNCIFLLQTLLKHFLFKVTTFLVQSLRKINSNFTIQSMEMMLQPQNYKWSTIIHKTFQTSSSFHVKFTMNITVFKRFFYVWCFYLTVIFCLKFTLSLLKNVLDQTWKAFNTQLGSHWKDCEVIKSHFLALNAS